MTDINTSNRVERSEDRGNEKSCEQQQLRCVDIIDSYKELNELRAGTTSGGKDNQESDSLEIEKFSDVSSITGTRASGNEKQVAPSGEGSTGRKTEAPPFPMSGDAKEPGGGGGHMDIDRPARPIPRAGGATEAPSGVGKAGKSINLGSGVALTL